MKVLLTLLCIAFIANTKAQQFITIPDTSIQLTDTLVIPVNTSDLQTSDNIISYQFNLNYDTAKLQYLNNILTTTIAQNGTVTINTNTLGTLNVSYMTSTPLTGSGAILKLIFIPLQTGTSDLTISDFLYNTDTITNVNNGTITVTNCISSINGTVLYSGGFVGSGDAKVNLYKAGINGHHQLIDSVFIGSNGSFSMQNIQVGNYYLYVKLNNNNAPYQHVHNTYLDSTFKWQNATILNLACGTDTNVIIRMFETAPIIPGNGQIKGKVQLYSIYSANKSTGEPIPGADITLEQEPDDEPIVFTETDFNGEYNFTDLPEGSYKIYVDIAGFPLFETYANIVVSQLDTLFTEMNFYVDTTDTSAGIYTSDVVSVSKIKTSVFSVKLYPNPVENELSVELINQGKFNIEILNINAQSLYKSVIDRNTKIDMSKYLSGLYFIKLQSKNTVIIKRIIKQ